MGSEVAYWGAVVATAPILALAAIVELRVVKWPKIPPFLRWSLGVFVLFSMGGLAAAMFFGLWVLAGWSNGPPPTMEPDDPVIVLACMGLGIALVVMLPTNQIIAMIFGDLALLPVYWQYRWMDYEWAKLARRHRRSIVDLQRLRMLCGERLVEEVLARPSSVFVPVDSTYRLDIRNPVVLKMRELIKEIDTNIAGERVRLRKVIRNRKKTRRSYKKAARGVGTFVRKNVMKWQEGSTR